MSGSTIDDAEYASSSKSFKLEDPDNEAGLVVKRFSLPVRTPFCVSAENFAISAVNQDSRGDDNRIGLSGRERVDEREGRRGTREESKAGRRGSGVSSTVRRTEAPRVERRSVRSTASGGAKSSQLLSGLPAGGAFYIYSFDGRLLAEYNILGGCVRDYIYFGGRLIAEYQTAGEDLYYYTSDQINSTRIVTDSSGTVVYSAAHDPYGGIQKTWVNSYDPSLKFSGKEHDEESGLDYFGARYYDRSQYRFISVDPIMSREGTKSNLRNLYTYCDNNPISLFDPDGCAPQQSGHDIYLIRLLSYGDRTIGIWFTSDFAVGGFSLELPYRDNQREKSCLKPGTYEYELTWFEKHKIYTLMLLGTDPRSGIFWHTGSIPGHTTGCILPGCGLEGTELGPKLTNSQEALDSLLNWYFEWIWGYILSGVPQGQFALPNGKVFIVDVTVRMLF